VLFHPIAGRWGPACLRAATASVETVSPPLETLFYHYWQCGAFALAPRRRETAHFDGSFFSGIRQMKMAGRRYTAFLNDLFGTPFVGADRRGKRLTIFSACVQYKK
jgi:hypothetical protein